MTPLSAMAPSDGEGACSGGECFALRVLGDDMAPEFHHGDIVIVEPDGALRDGSFVLAPDGDGWTLRQLVRRDGGWALHALADTDARLDRPLADTGVLRGVVIQKSVPGKRRLNRFYV